MKSQRIVCLVAGTALAVTAVFGAAKVAYAEVNPTDTYSTAAITKQLKTVPGQALTETFTFNFEKYNDSANVLPTLDPVTIKINTNDPDAKYNFDAQHALVTYYGNTSDLMTAITQKFADSKPGIYEYKVTETNNGTEKMTYDDSVYFLRVIKTSDSDIKVQVIKSADKSTPGTNKVDPTLSTDTDVMNRDTARTEQIKTSGFVFNNTYKLGDDNAVMDKKFTLKKSVVGLDAAGTEYSFTVKFITPDKDNAAKITAVGNGGAESPVNDGHGSFTVNLSRDESVTFSNIQEGTLYTVTETSKGQFTPSASITTSAAVDSLPVMKAVPGEKGNANGYTIDFGSTYRTIIAGTNTNEVIVTNTYDTVNPTGIIINNLPFILMVGIPVVAAAGYVVSRRKA